MKSEVISLLLGAALLGTTDANLEVMKAINDSQERLRLRGFFDKSLDRESVLGQPQNCEEGKVVIEDEEFGCENVNFLSFLSMKDLEIADPPHRDSVGIRASDIWGWLSPTGREFTLLALDNGAVAVDSTDPTNPCIVAKMPTRRVVDKWGDVKVYENTMYHVKDTGVRDDSTSDAAGPDNAITGIEVYDLLELDQIDCSVDGFVPINLFPQFTFEGHGRSHNVAVNTQSGHLYSVGSEKCAGGLLVLDLKQDPLRPTQVGCVDSDGYTHDLQCLNYDGPDTRYTDKEICFAFNEDTLTIWDVTDPSVQKMVSRTPYPNQVYSHQGWTNNDLTKILLDDELDEVCNDNPNGSSRCAVGFALNGRTKTSTDVFDIRDLEKPVFEGAYVHPEDSIDHNLYVWGHIHRTGQGGNPAMEFYPDPNFAYFNNYLAGLKVVDIRDEDFNNWVEVGTFDIAPELTEVEFGGLWSGYMHPSGVYAASSIERGLFLLAPEMAFTDEFPQSGGSPVTSPTGGAPVTSPTGGAPVTSPTGGAPVASPTGGSPTGSSPTTVEEVSEEGTASQPLLASIAVVLFLVAGYLTFFALKPSNSVPKSTDVAPNLHELDGTRGSRAAPSGVVSVSNPMHQDDV